MEDTYKLLRVILIAAMLLIISAFFMRSCGQTVHESRTFKVREHVAPAVLVFASGAFEGVMDHLQFHYDKPNQFWNPDISWTNKYKNHDPAQGKTFAGKYFVAATDGWHLMKFGRNATIFAAFTFKIGEPRKRWYKYIYEAAGYWAVNRIGFNVTYNLLK